MVNMTYLRAQAIAAQDIWISMRRFGRPDAVTFVGYV